MSTSAAALEAQDRALERSIEDVLTALSLLSETSASSLAASVSGSSPGSAPPPGVVLDRHENDDLLELSLAEHYRRRFEAATEPHQRRIVLVLAQQDFEQQARRKVPKPRETTQERETRLLTQYVDVEPELAAVLEDKSESYFRKLRQRNGRDPYSGHRAAAA